MRPWLLALLLAAASPAGAGGAVWLLHLEGPLGPATADHLVRGLRRAEAAQAGAVVIQIDTPGGLEASMREVVEAILAADLPVIGYVAPSGARAASAGTYVVYATHLAAMAPATSIGAATPVQLLGDGGGRAPHGEPAARPEKGAPGNAQALRDKAVNDARAYLRGLAKLRGRNAEWADRAVAEAATLTAAEALELGVVEILARDLDDLLAQAHGRTVQVKERTLTLETRDAPVEDVRPDWRTRFLAVITDPSVAYLLLLAGLYGLVLEFSNPGIGAAGIAGAICLLLALYAFQLLPVSYSALGLLLLGVALMVAEALSPSFGALGIGGLVAFLVGSLMLFDSELPAFRIALPVVLGATAASGAFFLAVAALFARTRQRPAPVGVDALVGQPGEVVDVRRDHYLVRVAGELWQAEASEPLVPGERVRVAGGRGLRLIVTKE
ncbi:MAG: hypothetical protein KatS3mg124_2200 [Porticoccaceae bacterium]|nr:MAG: hypothetical protein KatS3mg124_2200 [Porticoccaceae bacterium]